MKILKLKFISMKVAMKAKPLAVALMLLSSLTSYGHAGFYDNVMAQVDDEFENAENKFAVIARPMIFEYAESFSQYENGYERLVRFNDSDAVDFERLYSVPKKDSTRDHTHALALAICHVDVKRVEKFLKVLEDPNDPRLWVSGYRQPYNLASLSADPVWPLHEPHRLQDRLKIIDLLGTTTINFNFKPKLQVETGLYSNPPLALATAIHGSYRNIFEERECYHECQREVQARLMLYGADPKIGGTSVSSLHQSQLDDQVERAFNQVLHEKLKNIRPIPYVKELLEKKREDFMKRISELSF